MTVLMVTHVLFVRVDITCSWVLASKNVQLVLLPTRTEIAILVFTLAKLVQDLERTCVIVVFQAMCISTTSVKQIVMMEPSLLTEVAWFAAADVKHVQAHQHSVHPAMEANTFTKTVVMILVQQQS